MNGEQLKEWRLNQRGEHAYKNNQVRKGWTQAMAAAWYGCSERTWRRWEQMDEVPEPVMRAVQRSPASLAKVLDGLGVG